MRVSVKVDPDRLIPGANDTHYARLDAKLLADAIGQLGNTASRDDIEDFIDALLRDHRTIQQLVFGVFAKYLERVSRLPDSRIDARNDAMRDVAQRLMTGFVQATRQWYIDKGATPEQADRYTAGRTVPEMFLPMI